MFVQPLYGIHCWSPFRHYLPLLEAWISFMPLVPLLTSLFPYTQPQELRRRSQRGGNRVQRGTAFGRHLFAPGVPVPNRLAIRVHRRGSGERCFPLYRHSDNLGNPIGVATGVRYTVLWRILTWYNVPYACMRSYHIQDTYNRSRYDCCLDHGTLT